MIQFCNKLKGQKHHRHIQMRLYTDLWDDRDLSLSHLLHPQGRPYPPSPGRTVYLQSQDRTAHDRGTAQGGQRQWGGGES